MITYRKHRVNETTVATLIGSIVELCQRDPVDETQKHTAYLTKDELRALLGAMESP
jgi:hypothetical protein